MKGRPLSGRGLSGRKLGGYGISTRGRGGGGASDFVPPPSIQLSGLSIAEDASSGSVVGSLSVINGSGDYTFTIIDDPDGKFAIDGDDLEDDATLDYETATSHQVTVRADNGVDPPIERTFTIQVINVLEVTLGALSLDVDEIDEGEPEDTVVGAVVGKSGGSTLSLIDTAGGRFKLSGNNIVAGATAPDYETATSHNITIRETHADGSNSPRDTVIAIAVLDIDDAPDTAPDAFEVGDWDLDAGDEEAEVTINSLPDDGGATITDVEYRLDGGSWVSSGGTSSFTISGLTNDQEYDVELRAVNGVGAGAAGDTKQVTPVVGSAEYVLLETGDRLLLETTDPLEIDAGIPAQAAADPLDGTEWTVIVQGGTTKKIATATLAGFLNG
jgi:hypothetical protein